MAPPTALVAATTISTSVAHTQNDTPDRGWTSLGKRRPVDEGAGVGSGGTVIEGVSPLDHGDGLDMPSFP